MKHYIIVFALLFFYSCAEPLSSKELLQSYTHEFDQVPKSKIQENINKFLDLNGAEARSQNTDTYIVTDVESPGFKNENSTILHYRFIADIKDNKYTITLRGLKKIVVVENSETHEKTTETHALDNWDKDDLYDYFDRIDKNLYNHLLENVRK